ncbi:hypothetical protein [Spongiimicrobium salis]|uniref:hypothetical protein n=1 Tax=Spongiimicrobium salis TaxID=1667022 RepID=UPI00374CD302
MGILKGLFGPSKKEIWSQIANDIGGDFIEGGFWDRDSLRYAYGEWEILLDTFTESTGNTSTTYTRIRVPFINKDQLRFKIYRENFFSSIGKFFGMQDIQINDAYFDDHYIIKGNNEQKIKFLLRDNPLKKMIIKQPNIYLEIRNNAGWLGPKFPKKVDQIYFQSTGVIKKKERLLALFELFGALLDRLVAIDSAYIDDPKIKLK